MTNQRFDQIGSPSAGHFLEELLGTGQGEGAHHTRARGRRGGCWGSQVLLNNQPTNLSWNPTNRIKEKKVIQYFIIHTYIDGTPRLSLKMFLMKLQYCENYKSCLLKKTIKS